MNRAKDMGVVSQRREKSEKNIWKTIQNKKEWTQKKIKQGGHLNYLRC